MRRHTAAAFQPLVQGLLPRPIRFTLPLHELAHGQMADLRVQGAHRLDLIHRGDRIGGSVMEIPGGDDAVIFRGQRQRAFAATLGHRTIDNQRIDD